MVIAGAKGSYIFDDAGKRYLDFSSQLVNTNIGHQHPKVVAAIKAQADVLCTVSPLHANEVRNEAARLICELAPARHEQGPFHLRRFGGRRAGGPLGEAPHRPDQAARPPTAPTTGARRRPRT